MLLNVFNFSFFTIRHFTISDSNIDRTYSFRILGLFSLLHVVSFDSNSTIIKLTNRDLLFTLINYIKKCKHSTKNVAVKIFNKILRYATYNLELIYTFYNKKTKAR